MELSPRIIGIHFQKESPGWRNKAGRHQVVIPGMWREISQTKEKRLGRGDMASFLRSIIHSSDSHS